MPEQLRGDLGETALPWRFRIAKYNEKFFNTPIRFTCNIFCCDVIIGETMRESEENIVDVQDAFETAKLYWSAVGSPLTQVRFEDRRLVVRHKMFRRWEGFWTTVSLFVMPLIIFCMPVCEMIPDRETTRTFVIALFFGVVPTWMVWLALYRTFRREVLTLDESGLLWVVQAFGVPLRRRFVAWANLRRLFEGSDMFDTPWAAEVEASTGSFLIFCKMHAIDRQLILPLLNAFINRHREEGSFPPYREKRTDDGGEETLYIGRVVREYPDRLHIASRGVFEERLFFTITMIVCLTGTVCGASLMPQPLVCLCVFCSAACVYVFFKEWLQHETLIVTRTELIYRCDVLLPLFRRKMSLSAMHSVQTEGFRLGSRIRFQTVSDRFSGFFLMGLCKETKAVAQRIQAFLEQSPSFHERLQEIDRWHETETVTSRVFRRRGGLSVQATVQGVTASLFFFATGAVMFAVAWLIRMPDFQVAVLIAVFIVTGLLLWGAGLLQLSVVVSRLSAPFSRYEIRVDAAGLSYRRTRFGIGRTKFVAQADIAGVEISQKPGLSLADRLKAPDAVAPNGLAALASLLLIDDAGRTRLTIPYLYSAEAKKISDAVHFFSPSRDLS